MRLNLKLIFITLILLAGSAALFVWYFLSNRTLPEHAIVIPKNSFAVVTINTKSLALKLAGNDDLLKEAEEQSPFASEWKTLKNAIEQNKGTGISFLSDLIFFAYQKDDAAFIGFTASLTDSSLFSGFMHQQAMLDYGMADVPGKSRPVMQADTSSALVTWNDKQLLILMPLSHHPFEKTLEESDLLFQQDESKSVLSDDNYKQSTEQSFDLNLWVNNETFLKFSDYAGLFHTTLYGSSHLNYFLDFKAGEVYLRQENSGITIPSEGGHISGIPCSEQRITGFWNFSMDLKQEKLREAYSDLPPLNMLPLGDEEITQLIPVLTGKSVVIWHDTVHTQYTSIENDAYSGDDTLIRHNRKHMGISACFEVADPDKCRRLITEWMRQDSAETFTGGWKIKNSGITEYLFLENNLLTTTTWPYMDGKRRPYPDSWGGLKGYGDLNKLIATSPYSPLGLFVPARNNFTSLWAGAMRDVQVFDASQHGDIISRDIHIRFKDEKTNGLIQLLQLLRKSSVLYF